MKLQNTIILLSLLLAVAQGSGIVIWAGNWDISQTVVSDTACYPENTILIEQRITELTASWVWAKTQQCKNAGLAGERFTQTVQKPEGNSIRLQFIVGKTVIDGTFTISDISAIFKSNNGASATCIRRPNMVYYYGTWDIVSQVNNRCNPDKFITLTQKDDKHVQASWTWDNSDACKSDGLAGSKFSETIAFSAENDVAISYDSKDTRVEGVFFVVNDQALFITNLGIFASFVRRQESVKWVGTWKIETQKDDKGCYPDTSIAITQDSGSITAKWTWANSKGCEDALFAGKEFTYTEPTPRGRSIYLGFFTPKMVVSGIFTVDGDQASFTSILGASATFSRKSSGSMGIIIVILLIVAVAAGGYFYVQRNKSRKLQGDLNTSLSAIYART